MEAIIPKNGHKILFFAPAITAKIEILVAIKDSHVLGSDHKPKHSWTIKKLKLQATFNHRIVCSIGLSSGI